MLIRSQDKESLVNLNNIESVDIIGFWKTKGGYFQDHDNANVWKVAHDNGYVGEFTTKQKAIKVLDMIQEAYECSLYCDHAFDYAANVQRPYIFASNRVFQIPQDKEVNE